MVSTFYLCFQHLQYQLYLQAYMTWLLQNGVFIYQIKLNFP